MHGHSLCNKNMRQLATIGCAELRYATIPLRGIVVKLWAAIDFVNACNQNIYKIWEA
jgi:hypothetical protein